MLHVAIVWGEWCTYYGGRWHLYALMFFIFFSDMQQSPSESWMLTSGEAGGGLWRRGGSMPVPKIQWNLQCTSSTDIDDSSTDIDDWVVMEEVRLWRRQRSSNDPQGRWQCFGCENNKQPLLKLADGVASLPCILRKVWNNNTKTNCRGTKGWSTKQQLKRNKMMSMWILWLCFLWREATFYVELHKWIRMHVMCGTMYHVRNNTKERQQLLTNSIKKEIIK